MLNSTYLKKPLVSIIIPLYNKAPYIKRALDSVLAQTVQNFEIIIVNDGSTDGSDEIVKACVDSRIRLLTQQNCGVSVARNKGIEFSNAELIAFLDADDIWDSKFLETILRLRRKYPNAGMYTTSCRCIDSLDNLRNEIYKHYGHCYGIPKHWEGIIPSVFKCAVKNKIGAFPGTMSTLAVPKKICQEVGGFLPNRPICEDLDFMAKIAMKYSNAHSSENLAYYMMDDISAATKVFHPPTIHPFLETINKMLETKSWDEIIHSDRDLERYILNLKISDVYRLVSSKKYNEAHQSLKIVRCSRLWYLFYLKSLVSYIWIITPSQLQSVIKYINSTFFVQ